MIEFIIINKKVSYKKPPCVTEGKMSTTQMLSSKNSSFVATTTGNGHSAVMKKEAVRATRKLSSAAASVGTTRASAYAEELQATAVN